MPRNMKRLSGWSLIRNFLTLSTLIPKLGPNPSLHGSPYYLTDYDSRLPDKIQWTSIPPGIPGTVVTLETRANLARAGAQNPKVIEYARSIQSPYSIDILLRPVY